MGQNLSDFYGLLIMCIDSTTSELEEFQQTIFGQSEFDKAYENASSTLKQYATLKEDIRMNKISNFDKKMLKDLLIYRLNVISEQREKLDKTEPKIKEVLDLINQELNI